jgi:hypothetical protein
MPFSAATGHGEAASAVTTQIGSAQARSIQAATRVPRMIRTPLRRHFDPPQKTSKAIKIISPFGMAGTPGEPAEALLRRGKLAPIR